MNWVKLLTSNYFTIKNILVVFLLLISFVVFHNLSLRSSTQQLNIELPKVRLRRCANSNDHRGSNSAGLPTIITSNFVHRLPTPRIESKFDYSINTRRLVLLAVHRMNEIVTEGISKAAAAAQVSCAKWWANPLQVRKNVIILSTTHYDDHELEFIANSKWENNLTIRTHVRVHVHMRPEGVEFLNNEFIRVFEKNESRSKSRLSCSQENGVEIESWVQLCSCYQATQTHQPRIEPKPNILSAKWWPVNASFMVGDYLNFDNLNNLFNIIPTTPLTSCNPLNLIIIIASAPIHFAQRYLIRTTYGSKSELAKRNATLYFIFGRVDDLNVQHMLDEEANIYQDIIQANFMDSYGNLTLKHLSILAYVYFSCSEAEGEAESRDNCGALFGRSSYSPPPHLLKADDDFFLNLDLALLAVGANPEVELLGSLTCGGSPFRQLNSKYYVPEYIFSEKKYPGFLLGGTILIRSDMIPKFLQASLTIPMMNLGDPYVTGLLSKALGIRPRNSTLFGTHFLPYKETDPVLRYKQLKTMIHSHMDIVGELRRTWDLWTSSKLQANPSANNFRITAASVKATNIVCLR